VAGVVAVGGSVAAAAIGDDSQPAQSTSLPAEDFPEPGVEHAHGLGVDPGDGTLYAATHYGLLRISADGELTRVANRYQDTMGFEVVGPNRFLASGHPDFREDNPPLLGLIESTDAGRTWTPLSLRGEADFHAIQSVHDRIYAYDSTSETFMVSDDGRDWDRRSRLVMRDFAVSPRDRDLVLATTESRLHRSSDGGRTWTALSQAPQLAVLGWDDVDEVVGVARDGAVHASADGGMTWSRRGDVGGKPEAMTLEDVDGQSVLFVAVSEGRIVQSADGGRSFEIRYSDR
jgi:photosystem II stability/assembly factor-like uncharacterized protein